MQTTGFWRRFGGRFQRRSGEALVQSQVSFLRVPGKSSGEGFRKDSTEGLGAFGGCQVQQGSGEGWGEGSGEGLGGFGAEPGEVQQGSGEGSEEGLGGFAEPGLGSFS